MAIGWLAVLQAVPWGQVIDNAPRIVSGAKKLWSSVSNKPAFEETAEPNMHESAGQYEDPQLKQRLTKLEKTTAELHEQMVTSTALIKELAEQNTQLIRHIEANRVRAFWLGVLWVATTIVACVSLVLAL